MRSRDNQEKKWEEELKMNAPIAAKKWNLSSESSVRIGSYIVLRIALTVVSSFQPVRYSD